VDCNGRTEIVLRGNNKRVVDVVDVVDDGIVVTERVVEVDFGTVEFAPTSIRLKIDTLAGFEPTGRDAVDAVVIVVLVGIADVVIRFAPFELLSDMVVGEIKSKPYDNGQC
jgi:hypothetical protein